LAFLYLISAPREFPINKIITVEKGAMLKEVAEKLEREKIVRYSVFFDALTRYSGKEKDTGKNPRGMEEKFSGIPYLFLSP